MMRLILLCSWLHCLVFRHHNRIYGFAISKISCYLTRRHCRRGFAVSKSSPLHSFSVDSWDVSKLERSTSYDDNMVALQKSYNITVQYHNKSCQIQVKNNETILSAMERQFNSILQKHLDINEIPSECRRGNCMTCAARFVQSDLSEPGEIQEEDKEQTTLNTRPATITTKESQLIQYEDGLSPYISRMLQNSQYFLTCSSRVQNHGLTIDIGQNHDLWNVMYQKRFDYDQTKEAAYTCMARAIRKSNEKALPQWMHRTEQLLLSTSNRSSSLNEDNL